MGGGAGVRQHSCGHFTTYYALINHDEGHAPSTKIDIMDNIKKARKETTNL